jgi:hypothetical protein
LISEDAKEPLRDRLKRQKVASKEHVYKSTGAIYNGSWLGGFRHGQGSMRWIDGAVYLGEWRYGQPCQEGKLTYPNGDVYQGGWANGRRAGKGTSTQPSLTYSGMWQSGLKHGFGHEVFGDANYGAESGEYRGFFKHG